MVAASRPCSTTAGSLAAPVPRRLPVAGYEGPTRHPIHAHQDRSVALPRQKIAYHLVAHEGDTFFNPVGIGVELIHTASQRRDRVRLTVDQHHLKAVDVRLWGTEKPIRTPRRSSQTGYDQPPPMLFFVLYACLGLLINLALAPLRDRAADQAKLLGRDRFGGRNCRQH